MPTCQTCHRYLPDPLQLFVHRIDTHPSDSVKLAKAFDPSEGHPRPDQAKDYDRRLDGVLRAIVDERRRRAPLSGRGSLAPSTDEGSYGVAEEFLTKSDMVKFRDEVLGILRKAADAQPLRKQYATLSDFKRLRDEIVKQLGIARKEDEDDDQGPPRVTHDPGNTEGTVKASGGNREAGSGVSSDHTADDDPHPMGMGSSVRCQRCGKIFSMFAEYDAHLRSHTSIDISNSQATRPRPPSSRLADPRYEERKSLEDLIVRTARARGEVEDIRQLVKQATGTDRGPPPAEIEDMKRRWARSKGV